MRPSYIFLVTLLCLSRSWANDISGTISFDKQVSHAGLIFISGKANKLINGKIDQKDKSFTANIAVTSPNSTFNFINSDNINHNIYANDSKRGITFDIGLMEPGTTSSVDIDWKPDTLTKISCKIHPKMRAYIANINASHHQIIEFNKSQKDYSFDFTGITEPNVEVVLLMPGYTPIKVTLNEGDHTSVEILRRNNRRGQINLNYNSGSF